MVSLSLHVDLSTISTRGSEEHNYIIFRLLVPDETTPKHHEQSKVKVNSKSILLLIQLHVLSA